MQEEIESAIVDCNYVIKRWISTRPDLLDYSNLRGLVTHFLKKVVNRKLGWRSARGFFASRILFLDIDDRIGYIKQITLTTYYSGTSAAADPQRVMLYNIIQSLDYEELNKRAETKFPAFVKDMPELTFKSIESIKF